MAVFSQRHPFRKIVHLSASRAGCEPRPPEPPNDHAGQISGRLIICSGEWIIRVERSALPEAITAGRDFHPNRHVCENKAVRWSRPEPHRHRHNRRGHCARAAHSGSRAFSHDLN